MYAFPWESGLHLTDVETGANRINKQTSILQFKKSSTRAQVYQDGYSLTRDNQNGFVQV